MSCSSPCARIDRRSLLAWVGLGGALALAGPRARASDAPTREAPPEIASIWPDAALRGRATLRVFGLHIYDIALWSPAAPDPARWWASPLALELQYARPLQGRRIAERSLDEMRRQGPIEDTVARHWLDRMAALFPDVRDGDRLTGVADGASSRFHHNARLLGTVDDASFTRRFFGIWLAPQTSAPSLRAALLGTEAGR